MTDKMTRQKKLAEMREWLLRLPPDALMNASKAAIILDVSTKTLARWREVKGLGPEFLEPVVDPGSVRSTQPYKYRKRDLDSFIGKRMGGGYLGFASAVEPWLVNSAGAIECNALDRLSLDELLEREDWMVETLLEAMVLPWANAEAMKPYRDELEASLHSLMAVVDSNMQTLQFEERTGDARGAPGGRGGIL